MFRFTIRDLLWLMVVVILGVTVFVTRSGGGKGRQMATRRASGEELDAISVRYKAAKEEFELQSNPYLQHRWVIDDADVIERFAQAAEACNDPEARVKDLAEALKLAQQLASTSLDKYENDVDPANTVYRIQYTRADTEARLRRAEQDLAAQATK
jgi:hypothetical protein